MKKLTPIKTILCFLPLYFIINANAVFSQDIIAKIKYEEAEAAFEKGEFQTTINKIDEVETMLKATSPKTMYLKIVSQYKLETPTFSEIESLSKNCNYYLNNYSKIEGIEEKYRDIYKISEDIKKYPKTEFEFKDWMEVRKKQLSDQASEKQKLLQGQLIADKLNSWNASIDGIKLGMDFSELPNSTWNYLDKSGFIGDKGDFYGWKLDRKCTLYIAKINYFKVKSSEGLNALYIDAVTNKVVNVSKYHIAGGKSILDAATSKYEAFSKTLKDQFGKENVLETESTINTSKNTSSYSKTITLPSSSPFIISYKLENLSLGGAGNQVTVSETLSVPNLLTK